MDVEGNQTQHHSDSFVTPLHELGLRRDPHRRGMKRVIGRMNDHPHLQDSAHDESAVSLIVPLLVGLHRHDLVGHLPFVMAM